MDIEEKKDEVIEKVEITKEEKAGAKPAALSVEDLQRQLDEQTRHAKNKEEEAARVQKKLEKFQADEDKRKKDEMTETERLKVEKVEAETKLQQAEAKAKRTLVRSAIMAEANKLKFKDPEDAIKHLDLSTFDVDETDNVKGVKEAVDALAKSKDYLLDKVVVVTNGTPRSKGKPAPQEDRLTQVAIPRL